MPFAPVGHGIASKPRGNAMDIKRFQGIAALLLEKHYGIGLNDTHLWDDRLVAECIRQGYRPYQVVAELAEEADLDRIDCFGFYGVPSKVAITAADETGALAVLEGVSYRLHSPLGPRNGWVAVKIGGDGS